jgi:CheY-like chemotaxis protein
MLSPKVKILVVDDDRVSRTILCRILQKGGYQVIEAENSEQALEQIVLDRGIDIVVSDILMPGDDGFELIRRIRENPALYDVRILSCSSLRDRETILKAREFSVAGYIAKPLQEKYVLDSVRGAAKDMPAVLESRMEVAKRLGIDGKTYKVMVDEFLNALSQQIDELKALEDPAGIDKSKESLNNLRVNAQALGAGRIEEAIKRLFECAERQDRDALKALVMKLEWEKERLASVHGPGTRETAPSEKGKAQTEAAADQAPEPPAPAAAAGSR